MLANGTLNVKTLDALSNNNDFNELYALVTLLIIMQKII